jgi:hypothetical protein
MPLVVCFNDGDEGDLVFRSTTDLATVAPTAEASVVDLGALSQDGGLRAFAHPLQDLVLP